jgi:hypothetical protein
MHNYYIKIVNQTESECATVDIYLSAFLKESKLPISTVIHFNTIKQFLPKQVITGTYTK